MSELLCMILIKMAVKNDMVINLHLQPSCDSWDAMRQVRKLERYTIGRGDTGCDVKIVTRHRHKGHGEHKNSVCRRNQSYQVVLQWVWPNVILDHFSQFISPCIRVVSKPGEEALWLLMLPFLPSFVWRLTRTFCQVLMSQKMTFFWRT